MAATLALPVESATARTVGVGEGIDAGVERSVQRHGYAWPWAVGGVGVLLFILLVRWWSYSRGHVTTDNAFIAGTVHLVSSRVAGTVTEVLVADHQHVTVGAPLLRLDARDGDLRVKQARNDLEQSAALCDQAAAQLRQAQAQFLQAEARRVRAKAEEERARLDQARAIQLAEGARFAAISRQEFDATKTAFEVAKASVAVAEGEAQVAQAAIQSAEAAQAVARARQGTAAISLQEAELQRSYLTIPAPVCGTVGRKSVEVGQRLQPGQSVLAIVGPEKWIMANFKETQLARMRLGQRVSIRVDALPQTKLAGRVESFAPASGSQFALLPPDNATGNFTKIVQRVPVKIVFDPQPGSEITSRLAPGISVEVEVELTE